jgi:hypothetical protein
MQRLLYRSPWAYREPQWSHVTRQVFEFRLRLQKDENTNSNDFRGPSVVVASIRSLSILFAIPFYFLHVTFGRWKIPHNLLLALPDGKWDRELLFFIGPRAFALPPDLL